MKSIRLENISKSYHKGEFVVNSVSFEAEAGEFVILVGPSGCGKTTILKMIAGLETISSGNLYFGDRLMNETEPKERNIGMVFQNYALYPHLSVYDNIAFPLVIQKLKKNEIKPKVESTAEMLGLSEYLHKKPKQLSGGQRQRVALGRAIIRKPDLFLFDEPLSNLDAKLRVQMRTEIVNLHRQSGTTSIYVTHDQTEAMTMGSKLVVLNRGRIHQIGSPMDVYNQPSDLFTASFLGSPQINIFEGEIRDDGGKICFVNEHIKLELSPEMFVQNKAYRGKASLGIRPENLYPETSAAANVIKTNIHNIEFLGHEQILYFTQSGIKCLRINNADIKYTIGDNLSVGVNPEGVLIFDEHGDRI